jgi:ribosomal protein L11 methyltransferase
MSRQTDADKNWFALIITVDAEASEAVEYALNRLDALGTEINNLGVKQAETLDVIGYFDEQPDREKIEIELNEALRIYDFSPGVIRQKDWRVIGNTDWLFEWKKHWKPTETEKFIIAPTWENVEHSDKIVIRIEPNMAFGTGTHETTRLCLKAIEENFKSGMSFLDVGTGTGILAVAAKKITAKQAEDRQKNNENASTNTVFETVDFFACDTDANSIKIAEENAALNEVEGINFYIGSIAVKTPQFDFICANLTIDVILPILPLLIEKTDKILILSGILKEQENLIIEELKAKRVSNFNVQISGEWISVEIKK